MAAHRIGIIGLGKIAQDQHLPVIRTNPNFELLAVSSTRGLSHEDAKHTFQDYRELLKLPDLDAVSICTPPQVRHIIAREALLAGKSVLLEKPPAATLSELEDLKALAAKTGKVVFTTWHAQYNKAVEEAKKALAGWSIKRLQVTWKEDVRHWHPGQQWIWEAGGFGVFDPGINALSIVTRIMPEPVFIKASALQFPANRDAPIAADLTFSMSHGAGDLQAVFDWRQTGPQTWDIEVETEAGMHLKLTHGGSCLEIGGRLVVQEEPAEYQGIYRRFDALLTIGHSEVDDAPFRLVADAFMVGKRVQVEAFED
ncbi:Gfo/Idh/MocA family protein [Microvirga arsenatis]|uniref:Gfo/Idh/MocA family oxidoreductase n=1 Tax=Microvirga arsenatis TaxID=2692265 RepID=A0ABW9YSD7_9HYPH|nr:Gfo/Idh/MocA family oxidoreductase [Microvirga arsenatis]NBJ10160.1 Gfo/Idh/MocA family oxidoreductase [Microvirga arsenatis]NBJ23228.1 Gfo/Idh/MocA family oxidoreductase [Microvirga arsenatis]